MSERASNTDRAESRRTRVVAVLESLPALDRLVLSLDLLERLSVLEIAGALKLTTREVEQRRVTSLTAIARELGTGVDARRAA